MSSIVTTTYCYKRPPRKRKATAIEAPAIVRKRADAAAPGLVEEPAPANHDRKSAIVTIKRKSRFGDVPDLTPEELQRRGEAADAMWRGLVDQATAKEGESAAASAELSSPSNEAGDRRHRPEAAQRRAAFADGVAAVPQAG